MVRFLKVLGVLIVFVFTLYIVGRLTGTFRIYSIPVLAMEPTLKNGSKIFVTNLKKAKAFDVIVYKRKITEKDGFGQIGRKAHFVHRLIAYGGDTINIVQGYVFVNGKFADDSTRLQFNYAISENFKDEMISILNHEDDPPYCENGTCIVALTNAEVKKVRAITRIVRDTTRYEASEMLFKPAKSTWTLDNYGPYVVPENHFFALGDNRHYSADSRFHGPFPTKNIVGIVLLKK